MMATQESLEKLEAACHTPHPSTDDGERTLHDGDVESNGGLGTDIPWDDDPRNAVNFSVSRKIIIVSMVCLAASTTTIASSSITPSAPEIAAHFKVSETASLLPLSLYVIALGFSPVLGGPLSETVGRTPVYYTLFPAGALLTLGCGLTDNFGALCALRFLAGLCWGSTLAVSIGVIAELFNPRMRGPMVSILILLLFLGPGLGPVLGAFATTLQNWRWTQYILDIMAVPTIVLICFTKETFPPTIKDRIARARGEKPLNDKSSAVKTIYSFVEGTLIRPVHMLATEPIVTFLSLYIAVNFGVLFSMYATVPYVMKTVYHFNTNQCGLVFLSVCIGGVFGMAAVLFCDLNFHRAQIPLHPFGRVPPEYRLPSAMLGSVSIPIGLFWFAWTAREDIPWVSPTMALVLFSSGQLCVFVSASQYITDTYTSSVVASATSANALVRYAFAGAFPLFILQMLRKLGIDWTLSFFGFLAIALLPIPWVLFKFGERIRAKSKYETIHKG